MHGAKHSTDVVWTANNLHDIPPSVCFGGVGFSRIAVRSRSSPALAVTTSTLSPCGVLWKHALITSSFSGGSGMLATRHAPPSRTAHPPARRLPRCPPPPPPPRCLRVLSLPGSARRAPPARLEDRSRAMLSMARSLSARKP
ncbi:hypothetical protein IEO21_08906 [Rhodonia placenta]|uniref:Uncharacterized protein n=1 Tax=Rhodonia placenta TaxID=104341 RepID=A0A8H7NVJ6_9APHY|nr:hypothetical protein IEO21_08906 [Postia placenta]